ncbi:MAG: FAD-dependent oxidoreductase, partial [Planctomycetota bacterium]
MAETMTFNRELDVRDDVDVFVAGGGPAGFAAALAAARHGLTVHLVDGASCFGGMGTAGLVPAFMTFGDGKNELAAGIATEVRDKMIAGGSPQGIRPEVLKKVYDELALEAGFSFSLFTTVVGIEASGSRITTAVCWGKSGLHAVRAKLFVDGTGDGDLCAWAGTPFEKGDENGDLMPGTLCSQWCKIDWQRYHDNLKEHPKQRQAAWLEQAIAEGVLSQNDLHLPGIWQTGDSTGGGNINHLFGIDHTDERSITKHVVHGRKLVTEYGNYYRKYVPGFENMELVQTGELAGIRETRRIMGDYVLKLEDFKNRASFEDEIGRYCYPVDIHPKKPDPSLMATFEKQFRE